MSTATKHKLVAFIRKIQITSELGKCTAVRWRENTKFKIKLCCLCQCSVWGCQGVPVPAAGFVSALKGGVSMKRLTE